VTSVLASAGFISVVAFCYVFYHYQWIRDRQFLTAAGPILYYGIPVLLTAGFWSALFLKPEWKINLTLVLVVSTVSLFLAEVLLVTFENFRKNWPAEIVSDTSIRGRANVAKRFGVIFDQRTRLHVINDLRDEGKDAVPASDAKIFFVHTRTTELKHWDIDTTLARPFPLGGIAKKTTAFCNENGTWSIYQSDEHGFNNPPDSWTQGSIKMAAVGDSFTHGMCPPSDKNFMALIRKQNPRTMNLGIAAMGPLSELAVVKEYLAPLKPEIVLWVYFAGNDILDLVSEQNNSVLIRYLQQDFSQHLMARQDEIDSELTQRFRESEAKTIAALELSRQTTLFKRVSGALSDMVKLSAMRRRLGLVYGRSSDDDFAEPGASERSNEALYAMWNRDDHLLELFRSTLLEAKKTIEAWGGSMYFVYLPEWQRYAHPNIAVNNRDLVLKIVKDVDVHLIDVAAEFDQEKDPLALFPFRGEGHYNEAGHELVAKTIAKAISTSSPRAARSVTAITPGCVSCAPTSN